MNISSLDYAGSLLHKRGNPSECVNSSRIAGKKEPWTASPSVVCLILTHILQTEEDDYLSSGWRPQRLAICSRRIANRDRLASSLTISHCKMWVKDRVVCWGVRLRRMRSLIILAATEFDNEMDGISGTSHIFLTCAWRKATSRACLLAHRIINFSLTESQNLQPLGKTLAFSSYPAGAHYCFPKDALL
jgi:hypothetical protein